MIRFSAGKSTALVIDSGSSTTSVCPVYDGYLLKKGVLKQSLAGDFISDMFLSFLQESKVDVVPAYQVASKKKVNEGEKSKAILHRYPSTASFHKMKQMV
jgi:actin-like protein 6A